MNRRLDLSRLADEEPGAISAPAPPDGEPRPTAAGPGRVLVLVYGILAVAATARGTVQVLTRLDDAPVAYGLSLVAGLVYVVATVALVKGRGRWRTLAWWTVAFELVGVLVVGAWSLVAPGEFPEPTVWSHFGQGYGFVPAVLPFLGLLQLWRTRARTATLAR